MPCSSTADARCKAPVRLRPSHELREDFSRDPQVRKRFEQARDIVEGSPCPSAARGPLAFGGVGRPDSKRGGTAHHLDFDQLDQQRLYAVSWGTWSIGRVAKTLNLYEAKTRLSQLVEEAAAGEEIVIAKAGKPRARLVGLPATRRPRRPGGSRGRISIAADFDAPLPAKVLASFWGGRTR